LKVTDEKELDPDLKQNTATGIANFLAPNGPIQAIGIQAIQVIGIYRYPDSLMDGDRKNGSVL
jgi:hypothetical protein